MIGRLVKQQHLRLLKQYLGKLDAHVPSLRECLRVALKFAVAETKAEQGTSGLDFRRLAVAEFKTVVEIVKVLYQFGIRIRLIVRASLELACHALDLGLDLRDIVEGRHGLTQDRKPPVVLHDLRKIAYSHVIGLVYPP